MRRRISSVIVALTLGLALTAAASAQPRLPGSGGGGGGGSGGGGSTPPAAAGLIPGVTAEMTKEMLAKVGYKEAEVFEGGGQKHARAKLGQVVVYVIHGNCEGGICKALAFQSYFGKQTNITWEYINAWYQAWRFTRLYRNKEGDLVFDMDVNFYSGVTPDYVEKSMVMYATMVNRLLEFRPK